MLDIVFIGATALFFVIAVLYVRAWEKGPEQIRGVLFGFPWRSRRARTRLSITRTIL